MILQEPCITFDTERIYKPGETLYGKVFWRLDNDVQVQKIQLLISGKCKVRWNTGVSTEQVMYKSKEVYIDHPIMLYRSDDGAVVSLTAGDYSVPFSYHLPYNLPPSYDGRYGNIKYEVSLSVQHCGVFKSLVCYSLPFTVSSLCEEQRPLRLTAETDHYGCCQQQGDFKFEVNIAQSVFSSGDCVIVNGFALNGSSEEAGGVKLLLTKDEIFLAKMIGSEKIGRKHKSTVLAVWCGEKIMPESQIEFNNRETLTIPNVQDSSLGHCQFINVEYKLKFLMNLPGECSGTIESFEKIAIFNRAYNPPPYGVVSSQPSSMAISALGPQVNPSEIIASAPPGGDSDANLPSYIDAVTPN